MLGNKKTSQVMHNNLWSLSGEAVRDGHMKSWESHPRPQMQRDNYYILKEGWTLEDEPIAVPFPPQAMLSGYKKEIGTHLTYKKIFLLSEVYRERIASGERILLHFGAVDQIAEVYVNHIMVGKHEGGYLPFSFDITETLGSGIGAQEQLLEVRVTDELDRNYPYGKQTLKRGGMWYTPVSGIWQNVWLEAVSPVHVNKVVINPDLKGVNLMIDCPCDAFTATVDIGDGGFYTKAFAGNQGRVHLDGACANDGTPIKINCWSPDEPYLYPVKIRVFIRKENIQLSDAEMAKQQYISCDKKTEDVLGDGSLMECIDAFESYFALRTISIEKRNGIPRVCLNGEPIFLHGVLDQGYYSDGLYLPACEQEFDEDILRMKKLGYNMLRKHIKVEPEYFYYACDRLGMLVMQDMVNNGPYSFFLDTVLPTIGFKKRKDTRLGIDGKRQQIFIKHTRETIEHLYNHPSIIAYTIFNEGWGQFQSDYMYDYVKGLDDSRLIDSTSGWFAQKKNDFDSEHIYFKVIHLSVKHRPLFLSECGGYSWQVDGHYYNKKKQYGYGACQSREELTDKIEYMYRKMVLPSAAEGMCGCVYTQLSDVEDEINGLYTYDRKVCKVLPERMIALAKELKDAVQ